MPTAVVRQLNLERGRCAMCGTRPFRPQRTTCVACAEMLQLRHARQQLRRYRLAPILPARQHLCCGWWTCGLTRLPWICLTCRRAVWRPRDWASVVARLRG